MAIHGNKSQNARVKALQDFKDNKITALVATEVAARGLDIKELPHVVNYELPNVPEDYVHRIGRTARAGSTGAAISLVSPDEMSYLRDIEKLLKRQVEFVPTPKFEIKEGSHRLAPNAMASRASTSRTRIHAGGPSIDVRAASKVDAAGMAASGTSRAPPRTTPIYVMPAGARHPATVRSSPVPNEIRVAKSVRTRRAARAAGSSAAPASSKAATKAGIRVAAMDTARPAAIAMARPAARAAVNEAASRVARGRRVVPTAADQAAAVAVPAAAVQAASRA